MNHSTVAKAVVSEVLVRKYALAKEAFKIRSVADTAAHGYIEGKAVSIALEGYPEDWAIEDSHSINEFLTANYPDYWAEPYSGWLLAVYYEPRTTTPPSGGSGGPSFSVKTTGRTMVSDIVLEARDAGVPDAPICVICNNPIGPDADGWAGGHNAQPVTSGQCCGPCNRDLVTPSRMQQHGYSHQQIADLPEDIA